MRPGLPDEEGLAQAAALLVLALQFSINLPLRAGKMKAHLGPPAILALA
jgi:hypothetical protein